MTIGDVTVMITPGPLLACAAGMTAWLGLGWLVGRGRGLTRAGRTAGLFDIVFGLASGKPLLAAAGVVVLACWLPWHRLRPARRGPMADRHWAGADDLWPAAQDRRRGAGRPAPYRQPGAVHRPPARRGRTTTTPSRAGSRAGQPGRLPQGQVRGGYRRRRGQPARLPPRGGPRSASRGTSATRPLRRPLID
jgi:hypothetical protein